MTPEEPSLFKAGDRLRPGALVLLGRPGISMPSDWLLGTVLWAAKRELLVETSDLTGTELYRQVFDVDYVRSEGTIEQLGAFRRQCVARVEEKSRVVRDCENALGRAREAVWQELDALVEGGAL